MVATELMLYHQDLTSGALEDLTCLQSCKRQDADQRPQQRGLIDTAWVPTVPVSWLYAMRLLEWHGSAESQSLNEDYGDSENAMSALAVQQSVQAYQFKQANNPNPADLNQLYCDSTPCAMLDTNIEMVTYVPEDTWWGSLQSGITRYDEGWGVDNGATRTIGLHAAGEFADTLRLVGDEPQQDETLRDLLLDRAMEHIDAGANDASLALIYDYAGPVPADEEYVHYYEPNSRGTNAQHLGSKELAWDYMVLQNG